MLLLHFRVVCHEAPNLAMLLSILGFEKYPFSTISIAIAWSELLWPARLKRWMSVSGLLGTHHWTTIFTQHKSRPYAGFSGSLEHLVRACLTIPQASVQHIPHIRPALKSASTSFLNVSDIPEWYHTTQSQLFHGKQDCKNLAIHIVLRQELQYTKNGEIFISTHASSSTFASSGSRKARSKQLWSVNFIGWMQKWIFSLLFDLWMTSVQCDSPDIFSMSIRTLWQRVAEVKKNNTVLPSMENSHPICM